MGLRIGTNMPSLAAQRTMAGSQREIAKDYAQLSSGSRITKSADDAAGLAISENLKSNIRGYTQAQRNANDGVSMVQVSEGGLSEISNILNRMKELSVQASSDTIGDTERGFANKEVQQLKAEMERIAKTTKWGNSALLDGSGKTFDLQVGINNDDFNDRIQFKAGDQDATTKNLGVSDVDFSTKEGARSALEKLDNAQNQVNGIRAGLGAIQNRLISTSDNLGTAIENVSSANSRIRDTDIAQTSADLTRNTVLMNSSVGVLAQANQAPAMALKLIG